MPIYVFENKRSGARIERAFPITKAPRKLRHKGRRYERIITIEGMDSRIAVKPTVHNLVSRALPIKWPYASKHDSKGNPVFSSRQSIREAVARANDNGEHVTYDD